MYKIIPLESSPACKEKGSVTLSLSDYNLLLSDHFNVEAIKKFLFDEVSSRYYYPGSLEKVAELLGYSIKEVPEDASEVKEDQ